MAIDIDNMTETIERLTMAHRYLYYVTSAPVIDDHQYDDLERRALAVVGPESPLRKPGSDQKADYSVDIQMLATKIYAYHHEVKA